MSTNFVILIFLSLCFVSSHSFECGIRKVEKPRPLIAGGGEPSYVGQWPWLASLHKVQSGLKYFCGATLISETRLITAAHCMTQTSSYEIFALLGQFNLSDTTEANGVRREIKRLILHKDFDELNKNRKLSDADVAILVMDQSVQFTDFIRPVCLPQSSQNVENVVGTVSGYGRTGFYADATKIPFNLEMKSIELIKCILEQSNAHAVVSERNFCAGSFQGIPCRGDSGSGFMTLINNRWTLLGIVSYAFNTDCKPTDQISFVKVPNFKEWIGEISRNPCDGFECPEGCGVRNGEAECEFSQHLINNFAFKIQNENYQEIISWSKKLFGLGGSFELALPYLIRSAYANDLTNFDKVLKFIRKLFHIQQYAVGYSALFNEMKSKNDLRNFQSMMLAYSVKEVMELPNYSEVDQFYKVQLEVLKRDLNELRIKGVEESGGMIRAGDYRKLFEWSKLVDNWYGNSFELALPDLIKFAYANDLRNFEKVFDFIRGLFDYANEAVGYSSLFDEMRSNNHLLRPFLGKIAGEVERNLIYRTGDEDYKEKFETLRRNLMQYVG